MAWTTTLVLILGIAAYGVAGDSFLSKLAKDIKKQSNPDVAPQRDANTPVPVNFLYALTNIGDVDRKHNTFSSETFVTIRWQNNIHWNPAAYGNVDMITLPAKYFWIPEMQPLHTAVEIRDLSPKLVTLLSNGTAMCFQAFKTQGLCDVSHIEYGSTCNAKNSLWGYSKDQVVIESVRGDTTGTIPFFSGSKYKITGFEMHFIDFPFDGKTYQILDTTVKIQEKPHGRRGPMNMLLEWY